MEIYDKIVSIFFSFSTSIYHIPLSHPYRSFKQSLMTPQIGHA